MAQLGAGMAGCKRIRSYPRIFTMERRASCSSEGNKNLHQAARSARMNGQYGAMIGWYLKYIGAKL